MRCSISWGLVLLVVALVLVGHSYGFEHGHHQRRSVRSMYKKSTAKSNAIAEYSNAKIREYQDQLNGIETRSVTIPKVFETPEICKNKHKTCDLNYPYRSIDGTCNNVRFPFWGAAFTPLTRLVPASYNDGFNEPRGGRVGSYLPNARLVSTTIHPDLILPDVKLTNMVAQTGQFLDHDMTLAPDSDQRCCSLKKTHDDCWDIIIPSNDSFYSRHNQKCLDFTRSSAYCFPGKTGTREQMNAITSFVDASQVYGSDKHSGSFLRSYSGGRLKTDTNNPGFLPSVKSIETLLKKSIEIQGAYAAGDERANEMPGLTTLHTLLFREHNRLADEIQKLRPAWSDEEVYQNARRILIAEWQHVVYGEFLPVVLGPRIMARHNLNVKPAGHSVYNPVVDPSIIQSFSTAAYRFGHTLINGLIQMMRESSVVNTYLIRDGFFNDSHITSFGGKGYDYILNGLLQQNSQTYDRFITKDLTCFLLREPEDNFGSDLVARNIQRGRDHGLQSYNAYRKICHMSPLTTWDNVPPEIPRDTWNRFRSIYHSPDHIDLFSAGIAETPVADGVTGPTFNCIKARQFYNVKFGDRFFYTHSNQPDSFTLDQIALINKRTWGDIICDNSILTRTQRNVFRPVSHSNPWISCKDRSRKLDVSKLLESRRNPPRTARGRLRYG